MKKKINIKTIASDLGVSPSTVSKALKDSHEISEPTKERIRVYAKLHNYRPNSLAKGLRNQKTNVLGIIIPEIVDHFFSRVLYGIESIAYKNDYNLMICLSKDNIEKEINNIEMLTNGNVDGLLVSVAKETLNLKEYDHFQQLIDRKFPLVFLDRVPDELEIDKVMIDDVEGGYIAAKHLLEKGCKNIAIIATSTNISSSINKEKGFRKALKEYNNPINEDFCLKVIKKGKEDVTPQIETLFNDRNFPDGIFTVNENYAAIVIKIATKKGLNIPKDIKIIAFTDGMISKNISPALTTIAQHGYTMGAQATELLMNRISSKNDTNPFKINVVGTDVVEREST